MTHTSRQIASFGAALIAAVLMTSAPAASAPPPAKPAPSTTPAPVPAASVKAITLQLDTSQVVDGVDIACTGIGQTRLDPKWAAYPVRVEFSNAASEYLSDAHVRISGPSGRVIVDAICDGPWVLLRLPTGGAYRVEATMIGQPGVAPKTITVRNPASGQQRFVIQFTAAG